MANLLIKGLRKGFGSHTVLAGVDLAVASGQLVAVLGPSGSGKTTLLRLICGFERADAGTIAIDGTVVESAHTHLASAARHIGYVAQEGALFPHLSVADNIVFGLPRRLRRMHHRVKALLELVGLPEHFAARWPQELSGGEQQRVALARALAPDPKLVLLDEPFSALDAGLRAETRIAVGNALRRAGATALIVTHDQSEALSMGDAVAVLHKGTLAQMADPVTLYRRPRDPALARFVGEAVLLAGFAANGFVDCPLGRLPVAAGAPQGPVEVLVRPEQIVLHGANEPGIAAHVRAVTFYGHDASVRLALSDEPGGEILARVTGHADPQPGAAVSLSVAGPVMTYRAVQLFENLPQDETSQKPIENRTLA